MWTGFGGGGLLAGVSSRGRSGVEDFRENKQAGMLRISTLAPPEAWLVAEFTAAPAGAASSRFGKALVKGGNEGLM